MIRYTLQFFALIILFLVYTVPANACFPAPNAKPSRTEVSVALKTSLDQPHYYFVVDNTVVFIPPEFVYKNDGNLAKTIPHEQLTEHTDLLKSLILKTRWLSDVQFVVADALAAGLGLVYDSASEQFIDQVKVVTVNNVCSGGREIYYENRGQQHKIVSTNDWVS